ncbi:MAG: MgtC/SapB transporter [Frankiales bacterium]|nr:MgtC/SapB transporter [Frankiales bacterium]
MGHDVLLLLIAAGLGGAIGLEREFGAQPAGFRTHVLVSLGAALFTVAGADAANADPTRIAAQVVTGIGFLGAGAILREGGSVKGLTTAASLFVTAAIGVACGLDCAGLAAFSVLLALVVLTGLKQLEREYFPRRRGHPVLLEIIDTADVSEVVSSAIAVLDCDASVRKVDRGHSDRTVITLSSPLAKGYDLLELAVRLRALDGVVGVELGS